MRIHNGGVYEPKITPGILKKYFKKFNTTPEKLDRVEARLIFLEAVGDYLEGRLRVDDLAHIATQMYYQIKNPNWFGNYDTELSSALSDTSEASWYKWKDKKKLERMRKRLQEYYDKYKHLSGKTT